MSGRAAMLKNSPLRTSVLYAAGGAILAVGLFATSLSSYLLFHTVVELFSVLTAFVIFALAWHTRSTQDNHYLLFMGIASLFTGALDLIHILAYKGMAIFPGDDGNLGTQFWIAFRFVFSFSFLTGMFYREKKPDAGKIFTLYFAAVCALTAVIFLGWFPACYASGAGLTRFKVAAEYVICLIFLAALVLLIRKRRVFDPRVLRLMVLSLVFSIASELSFTEYVSVYAFMNLLGHLFLLASVACIYRAIVVTGLVDPSQLLFRNLKQSEEAIRESEARYRVLSDELEIRVRERTAELVRINEELEREIGVRRETERRVALTNKLLKLYTQKFSRKEYLDVAAELIRDWSNCHHAGVRIAGSEGGIPFESCAGYNPDFLHSETHLSVKDDDCICTRVVAGRPELSEAAAMTPSGSFYSNQSLLFLDKLTDEQRANYRGICWQYGFKSLAVVPVRHRDTILGAIHIADERPGMVPLTNVEFMEQLAFIVGEALFRFSVEEDLVRQREELVRMNEQLRNLSAHIDAVREGERTSIAREIHDELGQVLTAIKMDVSWISKRLSNTRKDLVDKAKETLQIIDRAIQSVKRISAELRPGVLDDIGLSAAIDWACNDFAARTGIKCTVSIRPESLTVDRMRSTALFRILQESLTNIMRHARASRVAVSLEQKSRTILLTVKDNGRGITEEDIRGPHAFGLIGMRERVQFLGGKVSVTGVQNRGTTIAVAVPIDPAREAKQND